MAARVQMQGNNMADYRMYQMPRRPVGGSHHAGLQFQPSEASSPQQHQPPPQRLAPNYDQPAYAQSQPHQRSAQYSRNSDSYQYHHHHHPHAFHRQAQHPQQQQQYHHYNQVPLAAGPVPSRTLSNATTSTSSTGGNRVTNTMSTASSDIHRSASSRSASAPLSYVALMRRQKGTVWCDRAQPEDPRLQAQKRAAKQRAHLELHGSSGRSSTFASGKIRHSGKAGPSFSPSTLIGATVPVRLSANEIGDDDGDDHSSEGGPYHRRTGSARSSLGSMQRYPSGYQRPQGKTPPNEQADIPEVAETAAATTGAAGPDAAQSLDSANDSLTSSLRDLTTEDQDLHDEHDFGNIGEMGAPAAAPTAMQKAKKADDLRRRGSVDDRTTSLTGVRLFVANPDADD
ncbi:hypothetical protein UA08_00358 [Talaromyces atroroseus]|uniref:Uncharacterized protein n=1 Tax=Talaromyces atroroseus TaxID=1441469 RepID=A0A225AQV4_TALAT|nr:hypothetical protein UA08_00358 [Talaromyces atroroseus]OKL64001.1 hypothetical protein UA08_00358 [Talaromyces atroroseus]